MQKLKLVFGSNFNANLLSETVLNTSWLYLNKNKLNILILKKCGNIHPGKRRNKRVISFSRIHIIKFPTLENVINVRSKQKKIIHLA